LSSKEGDEVVCTTRVGVAPKLAGNKGSGLSSK